MAPPEVRSASPAQRRAFKVQVLEPAKGTTPGRQRQRFTVSDRTAHGARRAALARVNDPHAKGVIALEDGAEKIVVYLNKAGA